MAFLNPEALEKMERIFDDSKPVDTSWTYDQCFAIGEILDQFMHLQEMRAVQENGSRMDSDEAKDARAKCLLSILNAGVV